MLDFQLKRLASSMRDNLGSWLSQRRRDGVFAKAARAREDLRKSGYGEDYLREQWKAQKAAQLAARSRESNYCKLRVV